MVFLYCILKIIFTGEFATQTCLQGKFGEEIGSDQFGGCIMLHAPIAGANKVTGRIEYVEVRDTIISGLSKVVYTMSMLLLGIPFIQFMCQKVK